MKKIAVFLLSLLSVSAFAATKIQNEDVKSLAELIGVGGSVSQLINDSKLYDSTRGQQLSATLATVITGSANLTSQVSGVLPIANGGTNKSAVPTNGQLLIGNGTDYTLANITAGSNITVTNSAGGITINSTASGGGTVNSVSVATANGLAGSSSGGADPILTLTTSITGLLKGNGTAISAASSGTDYAPATSGSSILKGNGAGGFSNASSGTDYAPATSGSSILYGNGSGGFSNVTIGSGLTFATGTLSASGGSTSSNDYDVWVDTGAGHGSSSTKIRLYANTQKNTGGIYTVTHSATLGTTIQVSTAGVYMICMGDSISGSTNYSAITINDALPTTNMSSPLTYAQGRRGFMIGFSNSDYDHLCVVDVLSANDVIRAHDDGTANSTDGRAFLAVSRLSSSSNGILYAQTGNGYGSTDTLIRKYTGLQRNSGGSDIHYVTSAANGDSMVVDTAGVYMFCASDYKTSVNGYFGLTVNDSAVSTSIDSTTYAQGRRAVWYGTNSNQIKQVCFMDNMAVNDVVRVKSKTGNLMDSSNEGAYFFGVKLGSAQTSHIFYETGNGHGSVNTHYRKFSTQNKYSGNDISVMPSSRRGTQYKIETAGTYGICYQEYISSGVLQHGIDINGIAATTVPSTPLEYADGINASQYHTSTLVAHQQCMSRYLKPGDIVSPHDGSNGTTTDIYENFLIQRIN